MLAPALLDWPREAVMSPKPEADADITRLLKVWSDGDEQAFDQLMPLVYGELHRLALHYLRGEQRHLSLQATALVNEVCLRLLGWEGARWQNRGHFFGVSAGMMRRVLVDIARRRRAQRRNGGGLARVSLDGIDVAGVAPDDDLVALDEALHRLAAEDPRKASVVELRFFGGLSMEDTANALGISLRTAQSDWAFARAWLYRALTRNTAP